MLALNRGNGKRWNHRGVKFARKHTPQQEQEHVQQGKTPTKCSGGKRDEKVMGGNCFFTLRKKSARKTLKTAIIVRRKAKIRLLFLFFLALERPTQHACKACAWKWGWEELKGDRSYYAFLKDPTAIWKESRLRWAKRSNGGFALWADWQEKTLTPSDAWDLAEGSFSRLSCVGASFCWRLQNKSPRRAWTCKSAKNKRWENNNRKQASRDLTPFTKTSLFTPALATGSFPWR